MMTRTIVHNVRYGQIKSTPQKSCVIFCIVPKTANGVLPRSMFKISRGVKETSSAVKAYMKYARHFSSVHNGTICKCFDRREFSGTYI